MMGQHAKTGASSLAEAACIISPEPQNFERLSLARDASNRYLFIFSPYFRYRQDDGFLIRHIGRDV